MITCERPYAFYALLLLIPVFAIVYFRYRALVRSLGGFYGASSKSETASVYRRLKISLLLRSVARSFSWIFLVLSYAGLSWGTAPVPVQKSGNAVCLVFDISYSMCAQDSIEGRSRLDAARLYAEQLLFHAKGASVAVVLAKGDGILAVPLTEDMAAVESLFENLSPSLMTSSGSCIGKGIEAALRSFPENSAQAASVWVFTDGDETDSSLSPALSESVQYGIPVTLIGFGSVKGSSVTAGDGVTEVTTYLREDKLKSAAAEANRKFSAMERLSLLRSQPVMYVSASSQGSAVRILSALRGKNSAGYGDTAFTYEIKKIPRYKLFLLFAVICFVFSFVAGEIVFPDSRSHAEKSRRTSAVLLCFCILPFFISCSRRTKDSATILKSTWAWYRNQYQSATAGYLQAFENSKVSGDTLVRQYALYGLAVTYMSQEENEAASERLSQISQDAPQQIRYSTYYDAGIIAYRNGDYKKASSLFKQAILADGTKIDAKINLELSVKQYNAHVAQSGEQNMKPVSEENDESVLEKAVFSLIRENEQKKWKSSQSGKKDRSTVDY